MMHGQKNIKLKAVMFEILEYFVTFVIWPYSLVKCISSVVFQCTVTVMVYTGECRLSIW